MTPSTPSGRRLWDDVRIHNVAQRVKADDRHDAKWLARILAIEAEAGREAVEAYRLDLATRIGKLRGYPSIVPLGWQPNDIGAYVEAERLLRLIEGEPHADPE